MQTMDTECYSNFWLCKFYDGTNFQSFRLSTSHALDRAGLLARLQSRKTITFNGKKYDDLVIACALAGFTNEQLKKVSDMIIVGGASWMDIESDFGVRAPRYDQIDLIEVTPGIASLKIYAGRAHSKKMQDLPFDPAAILSEKDMDDTDLYCGNDLVVTWDVYQEVADDIETRVELTAQYGVDMRSKSDAQIAEAAFKKLLGLDYRSAEEMKRKAQLPTGTQFYYQPPPFISFSTPALQHVLHTFKTEPFTIESSGQPKESLVIKKYALRIGSTDYQIGAGGLHSKEQCARHVADSSYSLQDVDAESFYPKIISILRMFPHQIGAVFLTIYDGWIEVRLEYKHAGNKKKAATFKIKINGSFGKLGSRYSILYAPKLLIQTTVTGQLCLLMLIEMLEAVDGISVVSANTDGVVIKCRRDLELQRDGIVAAWRLRTGFKTEANNYMALFSRDVNNYIAFKLNGEAKAKGTFADFTLAKNPERMVCIDAVKAYILNGTPLERTIRQCSDIRRFVTVRAVKGGGEWVHDTISADTVAQKRAALTAAGWIADGKFWYEPCGQVNGKTVDEALAVVRAAIPRTYLGKAVRWYYSAGQRGHIAYSSNGNLVARSEGAKPCMELPDVLPPDIDYGWYVREAQDLLKDLGCS